MKYKLTTDEGEKIFLYDIFDGNVYVTTNKFQIDQNIKRLGITNDFTKNTRTVMIRDIKKNENIVVVTFKEGNEMAQMLIDDKSNFDDVHDQLRAGLEHAFQLRETNDLLDLQKFLDENNRK